MAKKSASLEHDHGSLNSETCVLLATIINSVLTECLLGDYVNPQFCYKQKQLLEM